jgi:ribose transport system ATP-binding protein
VANDNHVGNPSQPVIELKGIVKRFPGVTALNKVDFDVCQGEVHVLFGENGSGKSTLVNIVAGTYARDEGEFLYWGNQIKQWSAHQARSAGVSPVFQDFSLVPDMTVEENLFLGRESTVGVRLDKKGMRQRGAGVLEELGFSLPLKTPVRRLSRSDQQMTEIAKALLQEVKLLILDEPTSSLTENESSRLFDIVRRLKERGVAVVYVSHRMADIRRLGDRVTVLRNGERIATVCPEEVTDIELVEMMTGYKIGVLFPQISQKTGYTLLEVRNLSVDGRLNKVSMTVRAGEVTGIAGLAGGGKSMVPRAVFGLEKLSGGEILHLGQVIPQPDPSRMLKRGIFYLPSDRALEGLALARPVRENASMASLDLSNFSVHGLIRRRRERREVAEMAEKIRIRPLNIERIVKFLSGGNQQKVIVLRGLSRNTTVFLLDDPTVGIDVAAKKEVYLCIKELVEAGAAVVFVSSELPELLSLSHRLYVVHRGSLAAELTGKEITERNVLRIFFETEAPESKSQDP